MADLFGDDEFINAGPPPDTTQQEVDPAAEFLAQQEEEIAGLESAAFGDTPSAYADVNGHAEDFLTDTPQTYDASDDLFNAPPTMDGGLLGGDGGDADGNVMDEMDPSQAYAAIAAADARIQQLKAEPPKIAQWREEHNKMLQEKDAEEEIKKQEWLEQARKELQDWERNRLEQLEKTKENNRTAEKEFIAERDENRPGSEWERVSKLCDFNPKSSKGTKDVSRMRSTLLQLKQHNSVKPVVAK